MRTILIALVAALGLAGGAHAAGTKSVKDWMAVCANTGACTAFGFSAEDDDNRAYLLIQRDAGPAAQPKVAIVFDVGDTQPSANWSFSLDGRPIAGVGPVHAAGSDSGARVELAGKSAAALIAALRNGQSLQFAAGESPVAKVSLSGSAAILLWVDAQQGRIDNVTALGKPGPRPASLVPPPVATPLIRAAPPVAQTGLPKHTPPSLIKGIDDCELDADNKDPDDIVARLSPGVVLWAPECSMAAYNEMNVFFVGDEHGGHLKRIALPEAPGSDQATDDEPMNVHFDATTQTLASFSKGRGIGDCGEVDNWVWTGKAFELISEDYMSECRGVAPEDWPPLFVSRQK
jgi:hypothetical protein